jgi:hypothetical protein
MSDAEDFSVRWAGQLYIATAGSYTFRLVTDDGQRLAIDGAMLQSLWDSTTHDTTTSPLALSEGWHDFVVAQTEHQGGASARLTVASGPDLAGLALPLDRTRPVAGRAFRYDTGVDRTDRAIPDPGTVESAVAFSAPSNAVVTGIDVSYTFNHAYWGDLVVTLIAPGGGQAVLRDQAGGSSSGTNTDRFYTTAVNGVSVNGAWRLRAEDAASLDSGSLLDFQLTVHYAGGEPPIPLVATYDGPVMNLGASVLAYDLVTWGERRPAGTGVQLRLRSGASEAACLGGAWSAPLTNPAGSVPSLPVGPFVQYRIELSSSGDAAAALDWVQLDYTRLP